MQVLSSVFGGPYIMTVKAIKPKRKGRQWNCRGIVDAKRCKNKALIEHESKLGTKDFMVPVKTKLCMPCSMKFNGIFPRLPQEARK